MSKVFLLGLGAQKAGTTWLADYLRGRDDCDMGFRKEYHVFDPIDFGQTGGLRKRLQQRIAAAFGNGAKPAGGAGRDLRHDLALMAFLADPALYFAYFSDLLAPAPIRATGDITPAYAGLSEGRLRFIRDGFAQRGVRVLPVFLLRDPVDRAYSALRMARAARGDGLATNVATDAAILAARLNAAEGRLRADYPRILTTIDRVFGSDAYIALYEDLFNDHALRAFCAASGLPFVAGEYARRVNATPAPPPLPITARRALAAPLLPAMEMVATRFGRDRLRALWPSYAVMEMA